MTTEFGTIHEREIDGIPLPEGLWMRVDGSKGQMLKKGDLFWQRGYANTIPCHSDQLATYNWEYHFRPITLHEGTIDMGAFGTRPLDPGKWYVIDPAEAMAGDYAWVDGAFEDTGGGTWHHEHLVIRQYIPKPREPRTWTGVITDAPTPDWVHCEKITVTEVLD